ncbi:MAG: LptF/LptG family permease [Bacteroidota bacterium]
MKVYRYILRAHAGPFIFSFGTLMFIFLLQFLVKGLDQLVGKGLGAWVITELIVLNLAWMVVLAVPMSVLISTLMAFGSLSSTHEITAMKAAGVSIYRMAFPVMIAAIVITILLFEFDNKILPEANHRARILRSDIERKKPTFGITPGLFTQSVPGYSILVKKTFEHSNDLEGITIYDYTRPNSNVVVTATTGILSFSPDYRKLIMDLRDGEIHELDLTDYKQYRRILFDKHRIVMNVEGYNFTRTKADEEKNIRRGDRELSAGAMRGVADSVQRIVDQLNDHIRQGVDQQVDQMLDSTTHSNEPFLPGDSHARASTKIRILESTVQNNTFIIENSYRHMIDSYWVEIHKKYSIPFACIVFVLVGVPLGIMVRRGGFGVACGLSLGFFVLYWVCLIGGEKLADRDLVSPMVGMWIANVLLGVLGIFLVFRSLHENQLIDWSFFSRFLPRRFRIESTETNPRNE